MRKQIEYEVEIDGEAKTGKFTVDEDMIKTQKEIESVAQDYVIRSFKRSGLKLKAFVTESVKLPE